MIDFPASPTTNQVFTVGGTSWRYNGASWAAYTGSLVGDITSVVAGTGLTGGGTSGDVTLNLATPVSIANGGTNATTAGAALTSLGAAPLASPVFTGTPSLPTGTTGVTQTAGNNSTALATTAFVGTALGGYLPLTGGQLNPGGLLVGAAGTVPGTGSLTLNANTVAPPAGLTPNLYIVGAPGAVAQLGMDAFGGLPQMEFRSARGTAAAPTAVQANDYLLSMQAAGYGASAYSAAVASINIQAAQNFTNAAQGTNISFVTTLSGTTTPVASLTLAGNTATFSGQIIAQQAAGQGIGINIITSAADATIYLSGSPRTWVIGNQLTSGGFYIFDNTGGQTRLTIDTTGACKNTTGTWSTISDTRAKTNIEPYDVGLQAILALSPIRYDLATDDWQGEGLVGFRAEEVAKVLPELCGTATAKLKGEDTELRTVAPTGVVFALCNAIKELKAELDSFKTQLSKKA